MNGSCTHRMPTNRISPNKEESVEMSREFLPPSGTLGTDDIIKTKKGRGLDANVYATKKTVAQGLLDIALLTANASQLKYVLQLGVDKHDFYTLMVILISLSLVLQVIVALAFLFMARLNINHEEDQRKANIANDITTAGVFLITVINVIISAFGISESEHRKP